MDFNFKLGWDSLTTERATQLVAHFSLIIVDLDILNAKFGRKFMEALIQRIGKSSRMKILKIRHMRVGSVEEGKELGV